MSFIGLLRTLEQITRPPTRPTFSDTDNPLTDGMRAEGWEFTAVPEPPLTPDELVGVRGLLQERYERGLSLSTLAGAVIPEPDESIFRSGGQMWCMWCNARQPGPHTDSCPRDPSKSSASDHTGPGAEPAPSPTIVQSAPPPTVDGEGPSEVSVPPAPFEGLPTSELLTRAADVIDISAGFASALGYCNEDTGTQLDVFSAELRDRAATFKAIEE